MLCATSLRKGTKEIWKFFVRSCVWDPWQNNWSLQSIVSHSIMTYSSVTFQITDGLCNVLKLNESSKNRFEYFSHSFISATMDTQKTLEQFQLFCFLHDVVVVALPPSIDLPPSFPPSTCGRPLFLTWSSWSRRKAI